MDPVNVPAKFEVQKKLGPSLDTPTLPFLQNFSRAGRMDPVNVSAKFVVHGFSIPEIIVTAVLGWGCEPESWGKGGHRGSGMVPFKRAFVTSYGLSIVTFPLSFRVSDILPLLSSSMPLFPTPPLVSPKFLHVPLGLGGWLLGYEERRCWSSWPCN